jgi:hypothetical protein
MSTSTRGRRARHRRRTERQARRRRPGEALVDNATEAALTGVRDGTPNRLLYTLTDS